MVSSPPPSLSSCLDFPQRKANKYSVRINMCLHNRDKIIVLIPPESCKLPQMHHAGDTILPVICFWKLCSVSLCRASDTSLGDLSITLKPPLTWGFLLSVWLNGGPRKTDFLLASVVEGFKEMVWRTVWSPKCHTSLAMAAHFMMPMAYTSLPLNMNWLLILISFQREVGMAFNNIWTCIPSGH